MELPVGPFLSHRVLTDLSYVFQKKSHGFDPWPSYSERRPRASNIACPGPLFSSSRDLTEEGRPMGKAKKAKTKETNLLSSSDHGTSYHPFLQKSQ
jgi:hypothetical protein